MEEFIELVLRAGRVTVDVSLYTLLPVMVVMMVMMRFLENYGFIERLTPIFAPLLRPFGLSGLSVLALIQTSLVSFIAPLPTLLRMENQGVPERQLSATLAAVLAMAPANALFPMAVYGVKTGENLMISIACGLLAAGCCYYVFGRALTTSSERSNPVTTQAAPAVSFLKIIEVSGVEAITIVVKLIPALLLSILLVYGLQELGLSAALALWLRPLLSMVGLSPEIVTPAITNFLAGSTALQGFYHSLSEGRSMPAVLVSNATIGFLIHSVNMITIAVLVSAGPKIARSTAPAVAAAIVGIIARIYIGSLV